jgi:hypothetical protein
VKRKQISKASFIDPQNTVIPKAELRKMLREYFDAGYNMAMLINAQNKMIEQAREHKRKQNQLT